MKKDMLIIILIILSFVICISIDFLNSYLISRDELIREQTKIETLNLLEKMLKESKLKNVEVYFDPVFIDGKDKIFLGKDNTVYFFLRGINIY